MRIRDFINNVCNEIKYKPVQKGIADELENHMQELKKDFKAEGLADDIAEDNAVAEMGDAKLIGKSLNKIHKPKLDWKLIILIGILLIFGFMVSFIKTTNEVTSGNLANFMVKFIRALFIGIVCAIPIYFLNYKKMLRFSKYFYLFAILINIYTLFFGVQLNGIKYFRIAGISVLASVLLIPLYVVSFVGNLSEEPKEKSIKLHYLKIGALAVLSLLLMCTIKNVSAAIILGIVYLIVSTVKILKNSQNKRRNIILLWSVPIILLLVSTFIIIATPNLRNSFLISFYPELEPDGRGYIGISQKLIINTAQPFGNADDMGQAEEIYAGTKYAILAILANYGWILTGAIIVAICLAYTKMIITSRKTKDMEGKLLIIGISSIFILETLFNILMNFNIMPKGDFNLPFLSYGMTELIINILMVAVILSVYRRKDIINYEEIKSRKIKLKISIE